MKCRDITKLLPDYLSEAKTGSLVLSDRVRAEVRRHLADCPECRAVLERQQRLVKLMTEDVAPAMPAEDRFLMDVRRRIRQSAHRRAAWSVRRWIPALVSATALVLIALGVWQAQVVRARHEKQSLLGTLAESGELPDLDPLSLSAVITYDVSALGELATQLSYDMDLDDLIDDLSEAQQAQLIKAIEQLYRGG